VYLYSISKTGNNCVSAEAVMIPNEWHNITVKYDNEFQKIDILVKRNGSNVLSWNGDIANGFSTNLRHLGISMNGSWSQSGRYEKAIIDNVSYSQVISNVTSNPMFSPSEGTYNGPQQITLSSTPSDATIRYTIDGSNPTETVGTIYSGPFQVSTNTTIKAVAYKTGWITSQVISGSYTITTPQTFQIGDIGPAGGLIFYKSNNVYYEAAPYDQSSGITWWNGTSILAGTVGAYGIDFGKSNTQKIVNTQGDGNYAASICDDLLLNGYSDWYLPSEDALEYMYRNLKLTGLGDFSSGWYWSSTELDATYARYLRFDNGFRDGAYGKYGEYYVRAMREFK
jgi:hypothetical protein